MINLLESKKLFNKREVAEILNCSGRTVDRYIAQGQFTVIPLVGSLRITASSLKDFLKRRANLHALENPPIHTTNDDKWLFSEDQ